MADDMNTDDPASAEQGAADKKGGILSMILPAVLAGGVALGVTVFDPLERFGLIGGEDAVATDDDPAGKDDKKSAQKKKKKAKEKESALAFVELEPLIVSLPSEPETGKRAPRLRIVIVVEGNAELLGDEKKTAPTLRDAFTKAARDVPITTLSAEGGLDVLRDRLVIAATDALGEDANIKILITDFLLT